MTTLRHWLLASWLTAMTIVLATSVSALAQGATPPAAEPPSFLLEPVGQESSYFDITMEPGSTQELTVALGNAGNEPVSTITYVADAYTLVNGGFGVEGPDDEISEPATWITYSTETLDLAPGEGLERTFTVSIPEGTAPGQYIAGLSIQTAESIAVGGSEMLRQIIKKSIAIFITVPGPETPELAIGDIQINQADTSTTLVIGVSNPGNVFLNPAGEVTMTAGSGEPVLTAPVTMGPIYAGHDTTLEVFIPTRLEPGTYTVTVALADEEKGVEIGSGDIPVTVADAPADATPTAAPVTFEEVVLEPLTASDGALQAVNVRVVIANPETSIPSARLTLHVSRDGELVEDYPLNSSLVLPTGATEIQQRYIPLGSWEPGIYTFAMTLEAVDPATGQITVLATHEVEETIEVP